MSYINEAGNLVITANNAMRRAIAEILAEGSSLDAECEFFQEGESPTASAKSKRIAMFLEQVRPEDVGALTDAPILAEVNERDEETGDILDIGTVFWFPDYMIRDPMRELANTGRVVFVREPAHPASMTSAI